MVAETLNEHYWPVGELGLVPDRLLLADLCLTERLFSLMKTGFELLHFST